MSLRLVSGRRERSTSFKTGESHQSEDLPERVASARGRGRPMRMDEGGIIPPNQ
jgi:hypothetical protein